MSKSLSKAWRTGKSRKLSIEKTESRKKIEQDLEKDKDKKVKKHVKKKVLDKKDKKKEDDKKVKKDTWYNMSIFFFEGVDCFGCKNMYQVWRRKGVK